jgi:hypothetical protein
VINFVNFSFALFTPL